MSEAFQIRGGKKLHGEITPQGAKNEALQILCAVLLTDEEVRIKNIPDIHDVNRLIEILGDFGVKITKNAHGDYTFKADQVNFDYIKSKEFKKSSPGTRMETKALPATNSGTKKFLELKCNYMLTTATKSSC